MLPLAALNASPSAAEIDHLITGIPTWYPTGHPVEGNMQIPVIPAPDLSSLPTASIAYDLRRKATSPAETLLHGYIADKKLRTHLRNPGPWVSRFNPFWGVIAPDFSIWKDEPPDRKIFSVRMSRSVGVFHALRGVRVVPTLRWGNRSDYKFCFLGVEHGSAVAVSNHGLWRDHTLREEFVKGLPELVDRLAPALIFVHGTIDHPVIRQIERRSHLIRLEPDQSRFKRVAT
jgi:hypothetical protein